MQTNNRVSLQHLQGTILQVKLQLSGALFSGYVNQKALVSWDVNPSKPQWCDTSVLTMLSN